MKLQREGRGCSIVESQQFGQLSVLFSSEGVWVRFLIKEVLEMIGRGERVRTSGLYVPNVALYQAELHPDVVFDRGIATG